MEIHYQHLKKWAEDSSVQVNEVDHLYLGEIEMFGQCLPSKNIITINTKFIKEKENEYGANLKPSILLHELIHWFFYHNKVFSHFLDYEIMLNKDKFLQYYFEEEHTVRNVVIRFFNIKDNFYKPINANKQKADLAYEYFSRIVL